jgi:hypothetical protein
MSFNFEPVMCACGVQRSTSDAELRVSGFHGPGSRPGLSQSGGEFRPCELRVCAGCWCVYAVPVARLKVTNVGSG